MLNFFKLTLISLLISTEVFAGCPKPVTPLQQGEAAPCEGFLFSPEKEREIRGVNEEYKLLLEQTKLYLEQKELYKKELDESEKIIEKEQEKSEKWRDAAEKATEKYTAQEESRGTRDLLFLIGGVLLTVGAGWAVGQASRK